MISLNRTPRFMLVGLTPHFWSKDRIVANYEETDSLVKTYGGNVFAVVNQNASHADNATYIGKGKIAEIQETIIHEKIDILVINDNIKPRQIFNLYREFIKSNPLIKVWDRSDLILFIFEKHARTAEAKLQIRLASMRHMGPRIYGMGMELSNQGGGIGARGIGETNTELMNRHWRNEMRQVNDELKKVLTNRSQQVEKRKRAGLPTISLVGYTNAGKTSLFNLLGNQKNYADNVLFATLDSNVCKFFLPRINKEVYLTDTIGFIRNLPPQLVDAFKSTLFETVNADVILHIIDVSDEWVIEKIEVVQEILQELKIDPKKIIFVFNKADTQGPFSKEDLQKKYASFSPQFVSAKTGESAPDLLEAVAEKLDLVTS